ncbi:putative holin protein [Salinivibrio phage CW02]|uniref:Putative holin protein n=1 Tax=Salinivibrio phage CW02 TaxID=1161935 RepID=H9D1G2_9CAUD|nr:Rz-like spanin [Salinivibrio phage CW02]AFE86204.1 putative holin protein [Salinivibrio phage CW02]
MLSRLCQKHLDLQGTTMKRLRQVLLMLGMVLALSGCSAVTSAVTDRLAGGDKPAVGIDTEIVAGDKEQSVKAGEETGTRLEDVEVRDNARVTTNTSGKKTDINGDTSQINLNEGVPFWQVMAAVALSLFAGLFLPQLGLYRKRG